MRRSSERLACSIRLILLQRPNGIRKDRSWRLPASGVAPVQRRIGAISSEVPGECIAFTRQAGETDPAITGRFAPGRYCTWAAVRVCAIGSRCFQVRREGNGHEVGWVMVAHGC
jgi:hypothetical protein